MNSVKAKIIKNRLKFQLKYEPKINSDNHNKLLTISLKQMVSMALACSMLMSLGMADQSYNGFKVYAEQTPPASTTTATPITTTTVTPATTAAIPTTEIVNSNDSGITTQTSDMSTTEEVVEEDVPPTTLEDMQSRLDEFANIYLCLKSAKSVQITWDAISWVTAYEVYRKEHSKKKYTLLETVDASEQMDSLGYVDAKISKGHVYDYKVVPVSFWEAQRLVGQGAIKTLYNKKIVATDHQKYSYVEMEKDIQQLCDKYHGLVRSEVIGKTADGRKLYDVVLGTETATKSMLVISNIHAREYMTVPLTMAQIERYLDSYNGKIGGKSVKKTLSQIAIHIVPMANPDGATLSQYGSKKIKSAKIRKSLKKYSSWRFVTWKANAKEVDLNSNFSYAFKKGGRKGPEGYAGKKPLSEKETKAIADLTKDLIANHQLKAVVNYHATGSIVFGDSAKKNVRKATTKMYRLAIKETGYKSAAFYKGSGHGNYREYVMYKCKVPSITIEIGRSSCPLPQKEFRSIWTANKDVVIKEAQLCNGW